MVCSTIYFPLHYNEDSIPFVHNIINDVVQAQELRPSDSRMLVALGESYEKLDKVLNTERLCKYFSSVTNIFRQIQDAKKCFWKAYCVGDIEGGIALLKLAKLFDRSNDTDQAAAAYDQYIKDTEEQGINERDDQSGAYR